MESFTRQRGGRGGRVGFSSASRGPSRGGGWSGKDWGGKERGRGSRSARGQWRNPGVGSGSSYSGGKQTEVYCNDSNTVQQVRAFQAYFRQHLNDMFLDDIALQCFLPVDASILLQDTGLTSSLPNLSELLRDQPETSLNCMALALHTVLSSTSEQHSVVENSNTMGVASAGDQEGDGGDGGEGRVGMEPGMTEDMARLHIRLYNFGPIYPLKSIKAPLYGKCVEVQGTVVRVSNIKPLVTTLAFTCSLCHATQALLLSDGKYSPPTKCSSTGCRSKTFLPLRSSPLTEATDWQTIKIQELSSSDQREAGRIPRTIECELTSDLVDSCIPGDMVTITAVVKATSSDDASRGRNSSRDKCMFLLYLQAISVSSNTGEDRGNITHGLHMEFTTKDYYAISEIHSDMNVFRLIVGSLCPAIYGHAMVKAGLVLALFGGSQRYADHQNSIPVRGNPHVLVVGDPGLGKSQMLQSAAYLAPRGVYVCGNTTTTSGLTVTLSKEAGSSGEFALEAGALVLADQGCCCIDEFDKMGSQHQALLEAMEQQSISIAKAGVVCSLPARTSILAAANPVGGHYNKAKTVSENLKMSSALLSRFDLVFILLDRPDEEIDCLLSEHVMSLHAGENQREHGTTASGAGGLLRATARRNSEGSIEASLDQSSNSLLLLGDEECSLREGLRVKKGDDFDPIPAQLLRKYVGYARRYVHPRMGDEAAQVLQKFYLELRKQRHQYDSTPITTRQLESLIRLTEARARLALREVVTGEDATEVVQIMKFSMNDTFSDEFGILNFDRSQHGSGMSQRAQGKRFINELNRRAEQKGVSIFSVQEMTDVGKKIGLQMGNFEDLICSLNNQNYLLKKGPKRYQLQTASCL